MLKDAIESLLRSRLSAYDPSIDTSVGSAADIEIVQPVIARLGTFPLTSFPGVPHPRFVASPHL